MLDQGELAAARRGRTPLDISNGLGRERTYFGVPETFVTERNQRGNGTQ